MKSAVKTVKIAILIVLLALLASLVWANRTIGALDEREPGRTPAPPSVPVAREETEPPQSEETTPPPASIITRTLNVSGDLVCHLGLIEEARTADGGYDFAPIFGGVTPYVQAADYAVCCLETTLAGVTPYTGFPMFRAPDELASSLKAVGYDLISTASNHCMDSWQAGLNRTLDMLDQNGLAHVGTYRSQAERDLNNGITVVDIDGVSVAFLAYTYWTNGMPITGFEYAVNLIFNDYLDTLQDIDYAQMDADMAAARALDTDMIAVFMHWGAEDITTPVAYQTELADYLFKQGADMILGGHPHVPQPIELRRVTDIEGNQKVGFLAYCLGNLISCQNDRFNKLTASVNITIKKDEGSGETWIEHVNYVPFLMIDLEDHGVYGKEWNYRLWNIHEALEAYESGDNLGVINDNLYERLLLARDDIHSVLGTQLDIASGGVDARSIT